MYQLKKPKIYRSWTQDALSFVLHIRSASQPEDPWHPLKDPESLSGSSSQAYATTEVLEKHHAQYPGVSKSKVLRKIDIRLVPVLCALYLLAFLDRVNIGNAALFNLRQDLKLGGNEYNTALVIFFVPYVLFEVPSNLLLKRFKPHVWLPACLFMFGLVTVLQGFTQNYSGILVTRFFLGLFESGMLPGCYYLISMWYKRSEAQTRYTFLFSSCSLAGAFGGLLASAIGKMDGIRGYHGWRWVFILEGLLSCVMSISFYFLISDFPEEAKWLTAEEKAFVHARLQEDVGDSGINEKMTAGRIFRALKNYKTVLGGFMYFGFIVPAYSFVYFSPSIIQTLGHSSIRTQLLSVPPYACAFVVGMIVAALSDHYAHRFLFIIFSACVAIAGFAILFVEHHNSNLQYGALFLAATGTYCGMPIILCWFSMNVRGHIHRAVATGWQIGFGNIGGIIASYAFLAKDAPEYRSGYSICISFVCLSALASFLYFIGLTVENRRQVGSKGEEGKVEGGGSEKDDVFVYLR
ncbi:unnamed protein product [Somion occarium]|uniref:Major facilitator superfamily (MFS) profile domain-containing protein n=1 Tax=Somion occarium TaxID=3059160 RepID=A0ABP1CEP3_9APHY